MQDPLLWVFMEEEIGFGIKPISLTNWASLTCRDSGKSNDESQSM
ncbi:MAG TPA: hypothetical protein VE445_02815 [Nitrososphaeraceae archaeon]|nr:hypothetical protein [Nitrososphaeraceae archaeon]